MAIESERLKVRERMSGREKWTLALLVLISVFLFADQNAMNPVVKEMMAEYQINEQQIGLVGSAFTILGAVVSIVFGYYTDNFSRKKLLAFVVLVGEIPCFLTGFRYFTGTYEQLMLLRILTGIGIGGIFPITFSLIGDYFEAKHRGIVTALITTSWGIGQIAGQAMAGMLAVPFGWRFPFIVAAVPNFILVPLFLLIAKEPKRGGKENEISVLLEYGIEYNEKIKLSDIKKLFKNKTNILGFLQGIPGSFPWGVLPFFLIPFYEDKGFSKEFATLLTVILGMGACVGGIAGGYIGDLLYRKVPKHQPLFCAIMVALGVIPAYILVTMNLTPDMGMKAMLVPLVCVVLTGIVVTMPGPNIKAILINVNPPEFRGSAFGMHNLADSLGRGIGPFVGGVLITSFGYKAALLSGVFVWLPCAIIYALMALTIDKDLGNLHLYLSEKGNQLKARTNQIQA
ncbi:MAG: MFS transporter [Bacillota bacterium]